MSRQRCKHCGRFVGPDFLVVDGNLLCPVCVEVVCDFAHCADCGRVINLDVDDFVESKHRTYCRDCICG